jgi:hypothetical protein
MIPSYERHVLLVFPIWRNKVLEVSFEEPIDKHYTFESSCWQHVFFMRTLTLLQYAKLSFSPSPHQKSFF